MIIEYLDGSTLEGNTIVFSGSNQIVVDNIYNIPLEEIDCIKDNIERS